MIATIAVTMTDMIAIVTIVIMTEIEIGIAIGTTIEITGDPTTIMMTTITLSGIGVLVGHGTYQGANTDDAEKELLKRHFTGGSDFAKTP